MKTAFDYKDQPSFWLTDTKMKRFKQGEEFAKKKQNSRDINDKIRCSSTQKHCPEKNDSTNPHILW